MDTKRLAKIFYFINIFPGPNARHVQMAKMIDSFMENSVEVEFVLRRFEKEFADNIKSFYSLRNEFAYEEIKSIRYLPIDYDFRFRFNLLRRLGTLIQVEGGETDRQTAIYTRQPTRGESLLEDIVRFKLRSANKHFPKVIAEVHERPSERGFKAVGLLDAVVVINPELKKVLIESGVDAGKILLAPSGVDVEDYRKKSQKDRSSIRVELDLPDDKHIIVYTGHLGYDRGVDTLVKAARYLDDEYLIVVVGGKTDDIRSVSQLISEEKVDSKVRMIGNMPASSIPLYQLSSDALVIPYSQKWRFQSWSSPMKLYEYMATKRPIISTDFKTIRSVLDERSCVFVKPDNPEEMSQAIKRCMDDKELSDSISQRAFEIVQNFSWDKRAKKIINFISELE